MSVPEPAPLRRSARPPPDARRLHRCRFPPNRAGQRHARGRVSSSVWVQRGESPAACAILTAVSEMSRILSGSPSRIAASAPWATEMAPIHSSTGTSGLARRRCDAPVLECIGAFSVAHGALAAIRLGLPDGIRDISDTAVNRPQAAGLSPRCGRALWTLFRAHRVVQRDSAGIYTCAAFAVRGAAARSDVVERVPRSSTIRKPAELAMLEGGPRPVKRRVYAHATQWGRTCSSPEMPTPSCLDRSRSSLSRRGCRQRGRSVTCWLDYAASHRIPAMHHSPGSTTRDIAHGMLHASRRVCGRCPHEATRIGCLVEERT